MKRQTFTIRVTRKEFLTLPLAIRRKVLKAQAKKYAERMAVAGAWANQDEEDP